ncbi:MAG: ABC transporter ATP-binding protein/permease [Candidatus Thermoplasmatota archaeon]|nr:ABC transporter ATP-binding protein/permease [Candidatus Thermoplasmatota archaeon]
MKDDYEKEEEKFINTLGATASLKRLIKDVAKERKSFATVVIAVVTTATALAFYPLAIGYAVNSMANRDMYGVIFYGLVFLLLYLIQMIANRFRVIHTTKISQLAVKGLRDRSFTSIHSVPISFFTVVKSGFLISRITNDAETIGDFLTFQIPQVISGFSAVILSIVIMLYLDPTLTLYALIILPVLSIFTLSLQGKVRENYLKTRKTIAAITGNLAENINSIRSIKAFNVETYVNSKFDSLNTENLDANIKASRLSSAYGAVIRVLEFIGISIVIYEGVIELQIGLITIGTLVSFIFYVQEFFDPVTQLSQLYNAYQSSIVGAGRIYGIIDSPKEIIPEGSVPVDTFETALELRNVTFSYGEDTALNDVNLTISNKEKVGIVGHTGAGKTTLSNLMLKLYLPEKGEILLDTNDTRNILTSRYRDIIIPVLQEPFLFRGTLYENIRIAKKDASNEEIEKLALEFGLERIFSRLPDGLNTDAGELGRNLSEGQKQAIAILRAIIRAPQVLIMDEPTSNIDPFSEKDIFASLEKFSENRTLILITHRFSMISLVDRIVVVDQGKIIENGDFETLMKKKGMFYSMYNIVNANDNWSV